MNYDRAAQGSAQLFQCKAVSIFPTGENAQFWTCRSNAAEKFILIRVIFVEDSSFYFSEVVQTEIFCNINQIINGTLARLQNYCLKNKDILGGAHFAAVKCCLVPFENL